MSRIPCPICNQKVKPKSLPSHVALNHHSEPKADTGQLYRLGDRWLEGNPEQRMAMMQEMTPNVRAIFMVMIRKTYHFDPEIVALADEYLENFRAENRQ